jgi:DNA-nicking Smr family endonuclease
MTNQRDDPDEGSLFQAAMQDVEPLSKSGKRRRSAPRELTAGQKARREAAVGAARGDADPNFLTRGEVPRRQPLEYLEWKKDGVQRAVFDRLRRGGYGVEAELDLHRQTVKEARQALFEFLVTARRLGKRCVKVACGKGELSETPARLKSYLAYWLEEHPEVNAHCSAQRHHGGVGAVYALLRKSPREKALNREQHGGKSEQE